MKKKSSKADVSKPHADSSYKVVFIGNATVGKTCILKRYNEESFQPQLTQPTTAPGSYFISVPRQSGNVEMVVWDTAGQEAYMSMTPLYIRNSDAVLLVFDVSDKRSFTGLEKWLAPIKETGIDPVMFVIGNKIDLQQNREVTVDEAKVWAESHKAVYLESSAKTGEGIVEIFSMLAEHIVKHYDKKFSNSQSILQISEEKKRKCTC